MLKIVGECTRIEGHGKINYFIQKDEISNVHFDLDIYRGFEKFLIRNDLYDIPMIISRLCGICCASQAIASCKAIENLCEITVSEQTVLLRNLILTSELLKSHLMHFFFQSLPDLLTIFNIVNKNMTPQGLLLFNPHLTNNISSLLKTGTEISRIIGGRNIHSVTLRPGGIFYSYNEKDLNLIKKYVIKAIGNIEWILDFYVNLFSKLVPPSEFNLTNVSYISLHNHGNYDRYQGILGIKKHTKTINFLVNNFNTYFDKDTDLRGVNFFNNEDIMVGPLARYNLIESYNYDQVRLYIDFFGKEWRESLLFSNLIKLIEILTELKRSALILDNKNLKNKEQIPSLNSIVSKEGIGVIEAPRGLLLHYYHLDDENKLDKIKLYIATEINLPLMDKMLTNYSRKEYSKTGDINDVKRGAQMIVRAFDPCISCATH